MGSFKSIERRFRTGRRAWLRRVMAGRRARGVLASALDPSIVEVTRDMGDHRITFDPRDLIGRHLFTRGHWVREEATRVVELMDEHGQWRAGRRTLVELGANIGTQTLYLMLTERFDRALAVEADPDNAALLARNVAQNGMDAAVSIAAEAVGASDGTAQLSRYPLNRGGNSLVRAAEGESVEVPMRRVEAIMADHAVAPEEVALTWIDVEGFEAQLVPALGPLLEAGAPIFMEWTPREYGEGPARALLDLLARTHPRTVAFGLSRGGQRGGESEIDTRDVPMDVKQLDLFLFAPSKG